MFRHGAWVALALALALLLGCKKGEMMAKKGNADALFLTGAAMGSASEVTVSEVAAQRSRDQRVRELARRIRDDHRVMNREVERLSRDQKMTVKAKPDPGHKLAAKSLQHMRGAELDRQYISGVEADHAAMVTLFENQTQTARNAAVREWARRHLPMLREHYDAVRSLSDELIGGDTAGGMGGGHTGGGGEH